MPSSFEKSYLKNSLTNQLLVTAAGYFPMAQGHYFRREPEPFTVLIFCTAGKGYFIKDHFKTEINAGEILYCRNNTSHQYFADQHNPWTIFWFHIIGKGYNDLIDLINLDEKYPKSTCESSQKMIALCREALDSIKKGFDTYNVLQANALLNELLTSQIFYKNLTLQFKQNESQFHEIIDYMFKNIDKPINIKQLANHCHLSETYFIRRFKQKYGYPPIDYFNRMKIENACQLLTRSPHSIKEISYQIGFEDPLYFSRLFRKIKKQSPSEFREKQK